MSTLPFQGRGHFEDFRSGFGLWHICHVERHGHFTLKQLRLSLVNEIPTKLYSGPRLITIAITIPIPISIAVAIAYRYRY